MLAALGAFVVFAYLLGGPLGHVGISAAVAGSSAVQVALLAAALRWRLGHLRGRDIATSAGKVVLASAIAGTGSALVPFEVAAGATKELVVDERRSFDRQEGWFSPVAKSALEKLLTGTALNSDDKSKLDALLKLRTEILTKRDEVSALDVTLRDVEQQSEELRRNLAAIEKNKLADKLRGELTKRLSELATKGQEYGKRKVEIDAKLAELDVRFRDGTRQFKYDSKKTK